ncbi:ATP-binding cassette domain-containing protein [uncultured Roseibium sp.]|uniref:ABC transporter ATP-binding protein n=1 Tax=uncultured Roseibium sp. TaxID=1936171 RepID=UPI00321777B8
MTLPLTLRNLTVRASNGRVLLNVDDLEIRPGEAVGIRGPSGAGKSTLLYALCGLQPNSTGEIRWGETDILSLGEGQRAKFRRENVGIIFQDFLLFEELTALGNAALAAAFGEKKRRRPIRANVERMLGHLGIEDMTRSVDSFSGGERQRVAIARALAGDPAIILADEPTASLDREAADRLISDLTDLAREENKTFIAVSHDLKLLDRMDRVIEIIDGRLAPEAGND